jgi:outer membrane immunogenic protein
MTSKRFLPLAAAALPLLAAAPALGADILYEPPAGSGGYAGPLASDDGLNFNGLYAGIQAGGSFNGSDGEASVTSSDSAFTAAGPRRDSEDDSAGGTIGGHVGADLRFGAVVVGAVTDYGKVGAGSEATASFGGNSVTVERRVESLGSTRARLGLASDKLMVYGTAGVAYGKVETETRVDDPSNIVGDGVTRDSDTLVGTTYGGGVDYMIHDKVSLGAEYTYSNLGNAKSPARFNERGGGRFTVQDAGEDVKLHKIEGKLSYHFF